MSAADRVVRVLLWRHGEHATSRKQALTADGTAWFSLLTIADTNHRPLPLTVHVADRPQRFSSVWLHLPKDYIPTQCEIESCTRALNNLHMGNKMDIIGAEVPDEEDGIETLKMDFVSHLSCIDAMTRYHSTFCIRRCSGIDGRLVLICTARKI